MTIFVQPITIMTQREDGWLSLFCWGFFLIPTNNKLPSLREHTNYSAVGFSLAGVFRVPVLSCWCLRVLKLRWLQCSRGDCKAEHVCQLRDEKLSVGKNDIWRMGDSIQAERKHEEQKSGDVKMEEVTNDLHHSDRRGHFHQFSL